MTEQQEQDFKEKYHYMGKSKLSKCLGITVAEVEEKAKEFGLIMNRRKKWTPLEDAMIYENQELSNSVLAQMLGRSTQAVQTRRWVVCGDTMLKWSDEDVKFLKDNYGRLSKVEICQKLGKNFMALNKMLQDLGITRNASFTMTKSRFKAWLYKKAKDRTPKEIKTMLSEMELPNGVTLDKLMKQYWEWREEYMDNKFMF